MSTPAQAVGALFTLCLAIAGCGGSDDDSGQEAILGEESAVVRCERAMLGAGGPGDWQKLATTVGRFNVFGTGRDFKTAQKTPIAGYPRLQEPTGPIYGTKTPMIVVGRKPLVVEVADEDRDRAGLAVPSIARGGPYAEVRFVPCRDQPRTTWPAGWVLRDRDPVSLTVREEDGAAIEGSVGRP